MAGLLVNVCVRPCVCVQVSAWATQALKSLSDWETLEIVTGERRVTLPHKPLCVSLCECLLCGYWKKIFIMHLCVHDSVCLFKSFELLTQEQSEAALKWGTEVKVGCKAACTQASAVGRLKQPKLNCLLRLIYKFLLSHRPSCGRQRHLLIWCQHLGKPEQTLNLIFKDIRHVKFITIFHVLKIPKANYTNRMFS